MLESICRLRSVYLYGNYSKRNWACERNVLAGCFKQVLRISSKSALPITSTSQLPILRPDHARRRISTRWTSFITTKPPIQIKHQTNWRWFELQQKTVGNDRYLSILLRCQIKDARLPVLNCGQVKCQELLS